MWMMPWRSIGRFRYIAKLKCPYRVAGKASALRTGKRAPGRMAIQSCGQSVSARRGKRYTEIGLFCQAPPGRQQRVQQRVARAAVRAPLGVAAHVEIESKT